jgi:hypothetical protein
MSISCCILWVRVSFPCIKVSLVEGATAIYTRTMVSVARGDVLPGRSHNIFIIKTRLLLLLIALILPAERWHKLPSMSQHLDQRLTVTGPSSHGRCPPPC